MLLWPQTSVGSLWKHPIGERSWLSEACRATWHVVMNGAWTLVQKYGVVYLGPSRPRKTIPHHHHHHHCVVSGTITRSGPVWSYRGKFINSFDRWGNETSGRLNPLSKITQLWFVPRTLWPLQGALPTWLQTHWTEPRIPQPHVEFPFCPVLWICLPFGDPVVCYKCERWFYILDLRMFSGC